MCDAHTGGMVTKPQLCGPWSGLRLSPPKQRGNSGLVIYTKGGSWDVFVRFPLRTMKTDEHIPRPSLGVNHKP